MSVSNVLISSRKGQFDASKLVTLDSAAIRHFCSDSSYVASNYDSIQNLFNFLHRTWAFIRIMWDGLDEQAIYIAMKV